MNLEAVIDFDALFASHHRKVVRLAAGFVGPEHAEDVAQLAWRSAWKFRAQFAGNAAPASWLYRITANTACSWLRSQRRFKREDPIDDAALEIPDWRPRPDALMLRREQRRALDSAIGRLPVETQQHFAELLAGRSYEEQARRARVPLGTLKSRLHRGRTALTKELRGN